MRRIIPLTFFTWILLVAVVTLTVNCVHESSHAVQRHVASAADGSCAETAGIAATHHCPASPLEEHDDYDGCDSCVNCACHAPLGIAPPQLSYSPVILDLLPSDPFRHLPEVYLSKFIPPQNLA